MAASGRADTGAASSERSGGFDANPDPIGTVEDIRAYGYEPFVYASGSAMLNRFALEDSGLIPYEKHQDWRYNYFFVPRPLG